MLPALIVQLLLRHRVGGTDFAQGVSILGEAYTHLLIALFFPFLEHYTPGCGNGDKRNEIFLFVLPVQGGYDDKITES